MCSTSCSAGGADSWLQPAALKLRMPLASSSQLGCRRRRRCMKSNTPNGCSNLTKNLRNVERSNSVRDPLLQGRLVKQRCRTQSTQVLKHRNLNYTLGQSWRMSFQAVVATGLGLCDRRSITGQPGRWMDRKGPGTPCCLSNKTNVHWRLGPALADWRPRRC